MRVALVSTYRHPTRDSIERMLTEAFPEYQIDNLSVAQIVKHHPAWIVPNLWYVPREYARVIASKHLSVRDSYLRTTYTFRRLNKAMRSLIDPAQHVFSFQMQSLY